MKKTVIILMIVGVLFSCSKDCDDKDDNDINGLIELNFDKNFLVKEKWFLDSAIAESDIDINGDGITSLNLSSQFPKCDLDSYYVFEKNQPNIAVLIEGNNKCEDSFERFGANTFNFNVLKSESQLNFQTQGFDLLGGLVNNKNYNQISFLQNIKCYISPDSSFKLLTGDIQLIISNNNIVIVKYALRATLSNQPE